MKLNMVTLSSADDLKFNPTENFIPHNHITHNHNPANIYLFKANIRNIR